MNQHVNTENIRPNPTKDHLRIQHSYLRNQATGIEFIQKVVPQGQGGNERKGTHARESVRSNAEPARSQVEANESAEEGSVEMGLGGGGQNRIFGEEGGESSDGDQRVVEAVVRKVESSIG